MNKVKELVVTPILVAGGVGGRVRRSGAIPIALLWLLGVVTGIEIAALFG